MNDDIKEKIIIILRKWKIDMKFKFTILNLKLIK
jgi:hypothetical protein